MRFVLIGFSLALAAAGFGALYLAVDLIGIERGTTYAIAGAVLISSAAIVFALSVVVQRLEALAGPARAPARRGQRESEAHSLAPVFAAAAAADLAASDGAADAAAARTADITAPRAESPSPATTASIREGQASLPATPKADTATKSATAPSPPPRQEGQAGPIAPAPVATEPEPASDRATGETPAPPAAPADSLGSNPLGLNPLGLNPLDPKGEAPATSQPTETVDWLEQGLAADAASGGAPRIVGRYQASGVDYVMYSDGSIEADNGGARRRFGSLADLKAFISEPETKNG